MTSGPGALHPGRPDEHAADRAAVDAIDLQVGFEGIHLTAERVAPHHDVDRTEWSLIGPAVQDLGRQHDHPGAGAERRQTVRQSFGQRVAQIEDVQQSADGRRFAAGDDDAVQLRQFRGPANRPRGDPEPGQRNQVFPHVSLQRKDSHHRIGAAHRWHRGFAMFQPPGFQVIRTTTMTSNSDVTPDPMAIRR